MSYPTDSDLLWDGGEDENVEVDLRALIDKVLARYSAEFTVFRELLQNSDDAESKAIEIRFETKAFTTTGKQTSTDDVKTAIIDRWIFKNNGKPFEKRDWQRLKKIAEGNSDSTKIGAFGVGFYSLFSETEKPHVESGGTWMRMRWEGRQLVARHGNIPADRSSKWTSFSVPLREQAPMPSILDLTNFLATSLTFMAHISEISLYFDDIRLARLSKTAEAAAPVAVPSGLKRTSTKAIMDVVTVRCTRVDLQAELIRRVYASTEKTISRQSNAVYDYESFFGCNDGEREKGRMQQGNGDTSGVIETAVHLKILSADVSVKLDQKMKNELYRCTRKDPPSKLKYDLVYAMPVYDRPTDAEGVFRGLRADLDGIGSSKIFIGLATSQTTGMGGHMAGPFIPTVERESIDLVNSFVAVWNKELLYVGGFLSRVAYELELTSVQNQWGDPLVTDDVRGGLCRQALHWMKFFTFHTSTPSSVVSSVLQAAFLSSGEPTLIPVISTAGVRSVQDVRQPDQAQFGKFVTRLPVLPSEIMSGAGAMVSALEIKRIMFEDVLAELRSRSLDEKEMVAFLKWWISKYNAGEQDGKDELLGRKTKLLLDVATLTTKIQSVRLATVHKYIDISATAVPSDSPLAPDVLSFDVSKEFGSLGVAKVFPWIKLSFPDWLRHLLDPTVAADVSYDLNMSAPWAEAVLDTLARAWKNMSQAIRDELVGLLKTKTCIPTGQGMKLPDHSYISSGDSFTLFPDLAIVKLGTPASSVLSELMEALGVRKYVPMSQIICVAKNGLCNTVDLVKYIIYAEKSLDLTVLKEKLTLPDENGTLRSIKDLYIPLDEHRQLGLPLIKWQQWQAESNEANFLLNLGLCEFPTLDIVIELASSLESVSSDALHYLLENIPDRYREYDPKNFEEKFYIPTLDDSKSRPTQVFSDSKWSILGFKVVDPSLGRDALAKLKIREHPPASLVFDSLKNTPPPLDEVEAGKWFGMLAGYVSEFTKIQLEQLGKIPIVPDPRSNVGGNITERLSPCECYIRSESTDSLYSKLFVFIDFGHGANAFLQACGTKSEPSIEEVALKLAADPQKFCDPDGDTRGFLSELRKIAIDYDHLSNSTINKMKEHLVLLGFKERITLQNDTDGEGLVPECEFRKPDQIIVMDDINGYQLFGHSIFTAPQEDLLEEFYMKLGSHRLSKLMKESYEKLKPVDNSVVASKIRELVLERLPIFLHGHSHSKCRHSAGWLKEPGNFDVTSFGELQVTKSLNYDGAEKHSKQAASAVAELDSNGIHLYLAEPRDGPDRGMLAVDKYEVATSLCRHLFDPPKASDALLFMTILSTDLEVLKRRGYNVARILKQNKDCSIREATLVSKPPRTVSNNRAKSMWDWPNGLFTRRSKESRRQITVHEFVWTGKATKYIDDVVSRCAAETDEIIPCKKHRRAMKNFDSAGYCDVTGHALALYRILEMTPVMPFFVSEDITDKQQFATTKHEVLKEFANIVHSLAKVFKISSERVHAFYDSAATTGMVAFNRNCSIFLNLRYFEDKHFENVKQGNTGEALISWYFTLAHEIAHNEHKHHDAQHELLFSRLCEKFFYELGTELPPPARSS